MAGMKKSKFISKEHAAQLKAALKPERYSFTKAAEAVGIQPSTMSRIVNGKRRLTPKVAFKLYSLLGETEDAEFLRGYMGNYASTEEESGNPTVGGQMSYSWAQLYDSYSRKLKLSYIKASPVQRAVILEGLEFMVSQLKEQTA